MGGGGGGALGAAVLLLCACAPGSAQEGVEFRRKITSNLPLLVCFLGRI